MLKVAISFRKAQPNYATAAGQIWTDTKTSKVIALNLKHINYSLHKSHTCVCARVRARRDLLGKIRRG